MAKETEEERKYEERSGRPSRTRDYIRGAIFALLLILVGVVSYKISAKIHTPEEPDITVSYITGKLTDASDLITSELSYTGLVKYSDGNIPFLTQKEFSMIYNAEVKAGIDMSEVEIEVTEEKVIVTLPEVKVISVDVDPNSIEFYDEKFAIFNWSDKQDAVEAIAAAEADVEANADIEELKTRARTQAETIITGILKDSIGERTLEIK